MGLSSKTDMTWTLVFDVGEKAIKCGSHVTVYTSQSIGRRRPGSCAVVLSVTRQVIYEIWLLPSYNISIGVLMAQTNPHTVPHLPLEIIQSLQRVLSLPAQPEDPLDDLSPKFSAVSTLNTLFPDGALITLL